SRTISLAFPGRYARDPAAVLCAARRFGQSLRSRRRNVGGSHEPRTTGLGALAIRRGQVARVHPGRLRISVDSAEQGGMSGSAAVTVDPPSLVKSSTLNFADGAISLSVALVVSVLAARTLGPDGFGR